MSLRILIEPSWKSNRLQTNQFKLYVCGQLWIPKKQPGLDPYAGAGRTR